MRAFRPRQSQCSLRNSGRKTLPYERLEPRQLLATSLTGSDVELHLAANRSITVATGLAGAPVVLDAPDHGALQYDSQTGTLAYRPELGFTGEDGFRLAPLAYVGQAPVVSSLLAAGGAGRSVRFDSVWSYAHQETGFSVRVWDPIYAAPDWSLVRPGESVSVNVLGNDYVFGQTPWGANQWLRGVDELRIVSVSSGAGGQATFSGESGALVYAANPGFTGTDQLTYVVEDGLGNRAVGTLTVEISLEVAHSQSYFSATQWQHAQIDAWLEQFAAGLTGGWNGNGQFTNWSRLGGWNGIAGQDGGVQDGDIVQLAGNRLYSVSQLTAGNGQMQSRLSVVDLTDPLAPRVLSTRLLEGRVVDLFLDGDRLALVVENAEGTRSQMAALLMAEGVDPASRMTLIALQVLADGGQTEAWRAEIDGNYVDGFLVNGQLILVTNHNGAAAVSQRRLLGDDRFVAVSPGDFIKRILSRNDGFGQPSITLFRNGATTTFTPGSAAIIRRTDGFSGAMVSTFDLAGGNGTPADVDFIQSQSVRTVHGSAEGLLLLDGQSIVQLGYVTSGMGIEFVADGALLGSVLDSSAIDPAGDLVRVVFTDARDGSIDLHIFRPVDGELVVVGSLEDIAPGEELFATRFSADQLFVVTFEQVDPLFVIDISVAEAPRVAGELTLPGYSGYLRLIGDGLLLAIGREASNGQAGTGGLQVSLFDVSSPSAPLLLHRYTFAGGSSTVTAAIDHFGQGQGSQSVTWDAKTGMLHLPVESDAARLVAGQGVPLLVDGQSAIAVLRISREDGITLDGMTGFADRARRTSLVGDYVFHISDGTLQVVSRTAPFKILASLELGQTSPRPALFLQVAPPTPVAIGKDGGTTSKPAVVADALPPAEALQPAVDALSEEKPVQAALPPQVAVDEQLSPPVLLLVFEPAGPALPEPDKAAAVAAWSLATGACEMSQAAGEDSMAGSNGLTGQLLSYAFQGMSRLDRGWSLAAETWDLFQPGAATEGESRDCLNGPDDLIMALDLALVDRGFSRLV